MTSTSLAVQAAPGTRLVVYAPSDEATWQAMEQLVAAGSPQPHFPCWPAHQTRALVPQLVLAAMRQTAQNTVRDGFFVLPAK